MPMKDHNFLTDSTHGTWPIQSFPPSVNSTAFLSAPHARSFSSRLNSETASASLRNIDDYPHHGDDETPFVHVEDEGHPNASGFPPRHFNAIERKSDNPFANRTSNVCSTSDFRSSIIPPLVACSSPLSSPPLRRTEERDASHFFSQIRSSSLLHPEELKIPDAFFPSDISMGGPPFLTSPSPHGLPFHGWKENGGRHTPPDGWDDASHGPTRNVDLSDEEEGGTSFSASLEKTDARKERSHASIQRESLARRRALLPTAPPPSLSFAHCGLQSQVPTHDGRGSSSPRRSLPPRDRIAKDCALTYWCRVAEAENSALHVLLRCAPSSSPFTNAFIVQKIQQSIKSENAKPFRSSSRPFGTSPPKAVSLRFPLSSFMSEMEHVPIDTNRGDGEEKGKEEEDHYTIDSLYHFFHQYFPFWITQLQTDLEALGHLQKMVEDLEALQDRLQVYFFSSPSLSVPLSHPPRTMRSGRRPAGVALEEEAPPEAGGVPCVSAMEESVRQFLLHELLLTSSTAAWPPTRQKGKSSPPVEATSAPSFFLLSLPLPSPCGARTPSTDRPQDGGGFATTDASAVRSRPSSSPFPAVANVTCDGASRAGGPKHQTTPHPTPVRRETPSMTVLEGRNRSHRKTEAKPRERRSDAMTDSEDEDSQAISFFLCPVPRYAVVQLYLLLLHALWWISSLLQHQRHFLESFPFSSSTLPRTPSSSHPSRHGAEEGVRQKWEQMLDEVEGAWVGCQHRLQSAHQQLSRGIQKQHAARQHFRQWVEAQRRTPSFPGVPVTPLSPSGPHAVGPSSVGLALPLPSSSMLLRRMLRSLVSIPFHTGQDHIPHRWPDAPLREEGLPADPPHPPHEAALPRVQERKEKSGTPRQRRRVAPAGALGGGGCTPCDPAEKLSSPPPPFSFPTAFPFDPSFYPLPPQAAAPPPIPPPPSSRPARGATPVEHRRGTTAVVSYSVRWRPSSSSSPAKSPPLGRVTPVAPRRGDRKRRRERSARQGEEEEREAGRMRSLWKWIKGEGTHRSGNRHRSPAKDASSETEEEEEEEASGEKKASSRWTRGKGNADASALFRDSSSSFSSSVSSDRRGKGGHSAVGRPTPPPLSRRPHYARSPPLPSPSSRRTRSSGRGGGGGAVVETKAYSEAGGGNGRRSVLSRLLLWGNHPCESPQKTTSTATPPSPPPPSTMDRLPRHSLAVLPCPTAPPGLAGEGLSSALPPRWRSVSSAEGGETGVGSDGHLPEAHEQRTTSPAKGEQEMPPLSPTASGGAPVRGRKKNAGAKQKKKNGTKNHGGSPAEIIACKEKANEMQTHPSLFSSPSTAMSGASEPLDEEASNRGIQEGRWSSRLEEECDGAFNAIESEGKREYSLRSGFPVWKALPAFFRAVATRALDFDDDDGEGEASRPQI